MCEYWDPSEPCNFCAVLHLPCGAKVSQTAITNECYDLPGQHGRVDSEIGELLSSAESGIETTGRFLGDVVQSEYETLYPRTDDINWTPSSSVSLSSGFTISTHPTKSYIFTTRPILNLDPSPQNYSSLLLAQASKPFEMKKRMPWEGRKVPFNRIKLRYDIKWYPPIGRGTYGKVVEVCYISLPKYYWHYQAFDKETNKVRFRDTMRLTPSYMLSKLSTIQKIRKRSSKRYTLSVDLNPAMLMSSKSTTSGINIMWRRSFLVHSLKWNDAKEPLKNTSLN